jgi:mono/diheme cytochrome c family protein
MKLTTLALIVGSVTLGASYATVRAQQSAPASVLAGVFTAEQAKLGEMVYNDTCSACHGPMLAGGDLAPPLAGNDFIAGWKDMTVGDLLDKIEMTMPSNAPGSLMPMQYANVLAYVLNYNKYPAGRMELPTSPAPLKAVKMAAPPQQ